MNHGGILALRLTIVLLVVFSLSSLPGPLFSHYARPFLSLARGALAPNPMWIPAGPAMDTMLAHAYTGEIAEFNAIGQPTPAIDTVDWAVSSSLLDGPNPSSFVNNPSLLVTSQITVHGYYEIEFMLANTFWGINMQFGNNPDGVQLRQGIAHLIDKKLFTTQQGDLKGHADPIDSPVPFGTKFTQGGTTFTFNTPNSCLWDGNFTETGGVCTQAGGPPGGVAYHCNATGITSSCTAGITTGTTNFAWQPQIGSADFCAAADHFITAFRHAGFGTLSKNSNCVLQGPFPSQITSSPVDFFVRLEDHPRFELGVSIAQEICALFTGALTFGCNFPGTQSNLVALTVHSGTVSSFTCWIIPSPTAVNPCWWMYTAGFGSVFPIDSSLYFGYNSRFVSGVCSSPTNCITQPIGPCSPASVPTPSAADYMYLCNPAYDTASANVEFAPDVATAFSAATTATDIFGRGAYTIPIWTYENRNVYLNGWQGILNTDGAGTFQTSQFLWLNDYKSNPAVPGEIRQGFKQTTRSLSPYIGTTIWDAAILNNVFDTPLVQNPLNSGQLLDWMTTSHANLPNGQLGYPQCAAPPAAPVQPCFPATAVNNLRLNLRNDIFFQDGKQLAGFDAKFAFTTLAANGAFFGSSLSPMTCAHNSTTVFFNCADGVTVRSKTVVDIHLDSFGPFTDMSIGTTFVFPGRYWSANCPTTTWDAFAAQGNVPDTCMILDPAKAGFSYDPIANHILIGSGPWTCSDVLGGSGAVGFGCSDTGTQNVPVDDTYTLTRYGKGQIPGAAAVGQYFRSSGTLAMYIWAGAIGDTSQDTITGSAISSCNSPSQPTPTLGATSGCGHWQQGIGQSGGLGTVTQTQVNIFQRFEFLNWVAPQTWATPPCSSPGNCTGAVNPPDFMQALTGQTYFEGPNTIYSAASPRTGVAVGCSTAYNPTSPSISGGFDC